MNTLFTLHFATINTIITHFLPPILLYLHYTLLLLILGFREETGNPATYLHYTLLLLILALLENETDDFQHLHYTLLLLIQLFDEIDNVYNLHLHYTLLLLIQLLILLNVYNIIFLFFCRTFIFCKK